MMKYLLPAAALLSAFIPAAGPAQEIPAAVHVAYSDLDLRTSAGVRAFDRRIEGAIETVCPDFVAIDMATRHLVERCQAAARADVAAQRETVLAKAGRGNVELADRTIR